MRPYINNKPLRQLTIPHLSGGVNYRDGISQVLDNQLTDCSNVWFKNGILQTRPGIACAEENHNFESDLTTNDIKHIYTKKENFRVLDGDTYQLVVFQYSNKLVFRYYSDTDKIVPVVEITNIPKEDFTCNIFQQNADIYCYCSGYYSEETTPFYIFKITEGDNRAFSATRLTVNDVYIPTVLINVRVNQSNIDSEETMLKNGAQFLEGYNLLGNKYKILASSSVPYDSGTPGTEKDALMYTLLYDASLFKGQKVTVEITNISGTTYTHEVTINTGVNDKETENRGDGRYLIVHKNMLRFVDSSGETIWEKRKDFIRNNVIITAPCPNPKENYEKVLNMTKSEWFGGSSEGIYDGIHLFMGGNTSEKEKSLVCWSDFNNPLYFSENLYAYVGDKAQKVTAFGKQGESLIIFKEREIYATQYSSADEPLSADNVVDLATIDVTVSEVTFPMIQIHGFIGCDCPDSVQLCRNRLVWAQSDGAIYTLTSPSQWNERSIFDVSGMVSELLKKSGKAKMQKCLSVDWNGYYVLFVGDKLILMDYNSYGYSNVYSYSKQEDAQMYIPFWIWDCPKYNHYKYNSSLIVDESKFDISEKTINILNAFVIGNELFLLSNFEAAADDNEYSIIEMLRFTGNDDILPNVKVSEINERNLSKKEVSAMVQTKLFDFGDSTVKKSVPKIDISFGNNEGNPITVTTITDRGNSIDEIIADFEETDSRNPQFFKSQVIRNAVRHSNRIGYKFKSLGNLFIDSISIYFKILGGNK